MRSRTPPPKHLAPKHLAPRQRRSRVPVVVAGLVVVGAAGVVALQPSGPDVLTTATTGPARADGEPISICTRASLEDRAALTLVVGLPGVTDADDPLVDRLAEIGVGGVLLRDENVETEDQVRDLVEGLRERIGTHLLVAVDDEGGRVSALGGLGERIPSARRLGHAGPVAAEEAGRQLGDVAASVGIDWVMAPVADLDSGPASGVIGDRSFGDDPEAVAEAAAAFARGVRAAGVAVTAKHFPGHGQGDGDPHLEGTVDHRSLAALLERDLVPFRQVVAAGAEAVMVGHVAYPEVWSDLPASLEPEAYALLRREGFDGVAVTDALGMGAVHARWDFSQAPAMALGAGADVVLVNQGAEVDVLLDGIVDAVEEGRLDEHRLDDAVRRILALRAQDPDGTVCAAA